MTLDGDAQPDTKSALLDGVAQMDNPSAFFGTATPYSHEEWLYNGWTREDVSDPRPDPPWLSADTEREQMEAEDEYSRLMMAQSAAMLKLMLGRKREIVLLVTGRSPRCLCWTSAARPPSGTACARRTGVAAHRADVAARRARQAMRELKARLEAEYDRHWHRVNHGMPTGLVEVVEPRDQWFCVACGLRQHGVRSVGSACGAAAAERARAGAPARGAARRRQPALRARRARADDLRARGRPHALARSSRSRCPPARTSVDDGAADDDGALPELLGLGTTIENERACAPRRQGGGGAAHVELRGGASSRATIPRRAAPRQSRSCSSSRVQHRAAVGPPRRRRRAAEDAEPDDEPLEERAVTPLDAVATRTPCSRRRTRSR